MSDNRYYVKRPPLRERLPVTISAGGVLSPLLKLLLTPLFKAPDAIARATGVVCISLIGMMLHGVAAVRPHAGGRAGR
jgi:hypothetical protein